MLPAKLFAGLAVVFSIFAGLVWLSSPPPFDFSVHDAYFVFARMHLPLFCALTCLNFAVLYYAAVRIFHARWNRTLSLLHLALSICVGLSLISLFVVSARTPNGPEAGEALRWVVIPFFLGILSFVAGLALFVIVLCLLSFKLCVGVSPPVNDDPSELFFRLCLNFSQFGSGRSMSARWKQT
jgi:heme/copper-type cytochrome/quinol oxidase subunit 1